MESKEDEVDRQLPTLKSLDDILDAIIFFNNSFYIKQVSRLGRLDSYFWERHIIVACECGNTELLGFLRWLVTTGRCLFLLYNGQPLTSAGRFDRSLVYSWFHSFTWWHANHQGAQGG